MIYKGKIRSFQGSWGSGLGFLLIEDSKTHKLMNVPCDNGSTVRALQAAFGNVIGGAHDVLGKGGHVGKEIYWAYDDMGLVLGGFVPVKDAPIELKKSFKQQDNHKSI